MKVVRAKITWPEQFAVDLRESYKLSLRTIFVLLKNPYFADHLTISIIWQEEVWVRYPGLGSLHPNHENLANSDLEMYLSILNINL